MSIRDGQFGSDGRPGEDRSTPVDIGAALARHHGELRAYLIGLLRDRDAAEDVLQAVCLKAIREQRELCAESLRGWLFRVAHNEGIDWRRRQSRESQAFKTIAWWNQRSESEPVTRLLHDEQIGRIREAIGTLPVEQREIVEERIFKERTFAEIAATLDVPLGTVLTRMRLASKRLARALRGEMEP